MKTLSSTTLRHLLRPALIPLLPLLLSQLAHAVPSTQQSARFEAASFATDGRINMDVGGVWNGAVDISGTNGDFAEYTIRNLTTPTSETIQDIQGLSLQLPTGVQFYNDSAVALLSGTGCGAATAPVIDDGLTTNISGATVNLSFDAGTFDLPPNCTMTVRYELSANASASRGVNALTHVLSYTDAGVQTFNPLALQFNVLGGAKVLAFDDLNPTRAVNDTQTWLLSVQNTGSGGLFDVELDLSNINPGVSMQLQEVTQTAPATPAATGFIKSSGSTACTLGPAGGLPPCDALRIDYLQPQQTLAVSLDALVTGCQDIDFQARSVDRVTTSPALLTAQVTLDLQQPLINFAAPVAQFPYVGSTTISMPINGTRLGNARNLSIATNLDALGVDVINVTTADWTEVNGVFTYTGNTSGVGPTNDFPGNSSSTLTFEVTGGDGVSGNDVCSDPNGGLVTWEPAYTDVCGNPFISPTRFAVIDGPSNPPSVAISSAIQGGDSQNRFDLGQAGTIVLTLDGSNVDLVGTDPIVINNTLPGNIASVGSIVLPTNVNSSVSCPGGTCDPGETLTWTINKNTAPIWTGGNVVLQIPFTASVDACQGGNTLTNTAQLPALTSVAPASCALPGASSVASGIIGNGPMVDMDIEFNASPPANGVAYDTGSLNADCIATDGEGECITLTAIYDFAAASAGSWSNPQPALYVDSFGGTASAQYVPGTMEISLNGAGFVATSGACVSTNAAPSDQRLVVDLDCALVSQLGDDGTAAGDNVQIRYKVTVGSDALGSDDTASFGPVSRLLLNGAAADPGSCDVGGVAQFTQPVSVTVARPAARIEVQNVPDELAVCEPVDVRLRVFNEDNGSGEPSRDILVQLLESPDYEFISTTAPTYSGLFNASVIDELLGALGGPTFEYDIGSNDSHDETLPTGSDGFIDLQVRRAPGSPVGFGQSGISARVQYDDNFTVVPLGPSRAFNHSDSSAPTLVTSGDLSILASPQVVTITSDEASWLAYVTNGGNGPAFNVEYDETLPTNVLVDLAATNAANTAVCNTTARTVTATVIGPNQLRWSIGDLAAGESCAIRTVTTIDPAANCFIPDNSNLMESRWGCGGTLVQEPNPSLSADADPLKDDSPNFLFLDGELRVVHLVQPPADSFAELCDLTGPVVVEVRNVGGANVFDIQVDESLASAPGIDYVSSLDVEVSVNGAPFAPRPAAAPVVSGRDLTWTTAQIPELARLYPVAEASASGDATRPNFIRIRYFVGTDDQSFTNDPVLTGTASGSRACGGAPVNSAANVFTLPVRKPEFRIEKLGRIAGTSDPFAEGVVAAPGQTVEWKIEVFNDGDNEAHFVKVQDFLPGVAGSSTISGGGLTNQPLTSSDILDVTDIAAGGSEVFTINQSIDAAVSCANPINDFKATFGCEILPSNTHSALPDSTGARDTAELLLAPRFNSADIVHQTNPLPGGNTELVVSYTNTGAPATLTSFSEVLPTVGGTPGFIVDSSATPTLQIDSGIPQNLTNSGTPGAPSFNFSVTLGNNQTAVFRIPLLRNAVFDTAVNEFENFETDGVSDPNRALLSGTATTTLNFTDNCGTSDSVVITPTFAPPIPDVEIIVQPPSAAVREGSTTAIFFLVTNEGDDNSIAGNMEFTLPPALLGAGWNIIGVQVAGSPNGSNGNCLVVSPYTCSAAQLGTLRKSEVATVRVDAAPVNNGGSLRMQAHVEGSIVNSVGSATGNLYALDERRATVVGFNSAKTISSTTVNSDNSPNVVIGEQVVFNIRTEWFGLDLADGDRLQSLSITERLPANLAYLDTALTANSNVDVTNFKPTPIGGPGGEELTYTIADIDQANPGGVFEATVTVQVLNNDATRNANPSVGLTQTNIVTTNFEFDNGAPTPTAFSRSVARNVSIRRPALVMNKQVRRLPGAVSEFADSGDGDSGDLFQYRIELRNDGNAPAHEISVTDLLQSAKLVLNRNASRKGLDTAAFPGDGSVNVQGGTITTPSNDQIVFDSATISGQPIGTSFVRLDPGQSLIMLYEGTLQSTVNPGDVINNGVSLLASTVPGAVGQQDPAQPIDPNGEWLITLTDSAPVSVVRAMVDKTILTTSEGNDADANVSVGEQIRYEIEVNLPEGTSPNMRVIDQLPAGLRLVQATTGSTESQVTLGAGSSISCSNSSPVITPASQPANGPTTITWDFGDCVVASGGTAEQRRIRITYVAQVMNIPVVVDDTTGNSPVDNQVVVDVDGDVSDPATVDLSVQETTLALTYTLESTTGVLDSGGLATYRARIENTGDRTAHDLHIFGTMPPQLDFLGNVVFDGANSTSSNIGFLAAPTADTAGNPFSWGRLQTAGNEQDLDLEAGAAIEFTFQLRLNDLTEPDQQMATTLNVGWTSLDDAGSDLTTAATLGTEGNTDGERTGGTSGGNGGDNDLFVTAANSDFVSDDLVAIASKSAVNRDRPGLPLRIGGLVQFITSVNVQEGIVNDLTLRELIPAGFKFVELLSINGEVAPFNGIAPYDYDINNENAARGGVNGQAFVEEINAGTKIFNFGDLLDVRDPAVDGLEVVYTAHVVDDAAVYAVNAAPIGAPTTLTSTVLNYNDANGLGLNDGDVANASITVAQPHLQNFQKSVIGPTTVSAGQDVQYQITFDNVGANPAYNTVITDLIPPELDGRLSTNPTNPVRIDLVQVGSRVVTTKYDALGEYQFAQDAVGSDDQLTISLLDEDDIRPGETVTIRYTVRTTTPLAGGLTINENATVTTYHSLDTQHENTINRRTYTPNLIDDAPITTDGSGSDIVKAVDLAQAPIGQVLAYTITIPGAPLGSTIFDVVLTDDIPASLEVVSVTDPSGNCVGFSSAGTAGNAVRVDCDSIAGSGVADIQILARVIDDAGTVAGTQVSNSATFTFATVDGGTPGTPQTSPPVITTVIEPAVQVIKSAPVLSSTPLNPGGTATYTIQVTNTSSTATLYDLVITDTSDDDLFLVSNPAGLPTPTGTGGIGSGPGGTYIWTTDTDLAPGASFSFDVTFELAGTAPALGDITNDVNVVGFSVEDNSNPERRSYTDDAPQVIFQTGNSGLTKAVIGRDDTFAIGDRYSYSITLTPPSGDLTGLSITDVLPQGLTYLGATQPPTFVIIGMEAATGGAITPVFPTTDIEAGSPNTPVTINFGDTRSTGGTSLVRVTFNVVVADNVAAFDGKTLSNNASATFDAGSGPITITSSQADTQVIEPNLVVSIFGPATVTQGATFPYTIDVLNNGNSEAHGSVLLDRLPEGMRQTAPANLVLQVFTDSTGTTLDRTLVEGTDFTTSYAPATGDLLINLLPGRTPAVIEVGELLRLNYDSQLDPGFEEDGAVLTTRVVATEWNSQDTTTNNFNRLTQNTFGSGTDGNADDFQAAMSPTASTPVINFTKRVQNIDTGQLPGRLGAQGQTLRYTLNLSNSGSQTVTVDLTDEPDARHTTPLFESGTLSVVSPPTSGTNGSNPNGGAAGTGVLSFTGVTLNAGGSETVSFDIQIAATAGSGSTIENQAFLNNVPGFTSLPSDDFDDPGNTPGTRGNENPTITALGAEPQLAVTKISTDITGDPNELVSGDILRYTIVVRNTGDAQATNARLRDAIPNNTTYVANSTTLNGQSVPDVGGTTALAQGDGILIQSDDNATNIPASGNLSTQTAGANQATVTFDVVIDAGLLDGTVIVNQAIATGEGPGGPVPPVRSDDPNTPPPNDPTVDYVGNQPVLDSTKLVFATTPVSVGDLVRYVVSVTNQGNQPAQNVVFTDVLNPGELLYEAGTIRYDSGTGLQAMTDAADTDAGAFDSASNTVSVDIGTLAGNSSVSIEFQVRPQLTGRLDNQGVVSADNLVDEPTDFDGDDTNGDQPTPVFVGATPQLSIRKDVSDINGGDVEPLDQLQYTIQVTNIGGAAADPVTVTDAVDTAVMSFVTGSLQLDGVTLTDAAAGDDAGDFGVTTPNTVTVVTPASRPLDPGESLQVSFRTQVNPTVSEGQDILNTAFANAPAATQVSDPADIDVGGAVGVANLTGFVWFDDDHDNLFDANEKPKQGVTVRIFRDGVFVGEDITLADGSYRFRGITPDANPRFQITFNAPGSDAPLGTSEPSRGDKDFMKITNFALFAGENVVEQNLPIDPNGIIYDSVTRQPVPGAVVRLLRTDAGAPFPISDVCLGSVGAQGQTVGDSGLYAFFLIPGAVPSDCPATGATYEIEVTPPAGYTIPSTLIPATPGTFNAIGGCQFDTVPATTDACEIQPQLEAPSGTQATTYFFSFQIDQNSNEVFNNHIPIDPPAGQRVTIVKTAGKLNVSRGELVPYTISLRNNVAAALSNVEIRDTIPAGFKYVEGSSLVNGVKQEPAQVQGRTLTYRTFTVPANGELEVKLLLVVGAGVGDAEYVNRAQAFDAVSGNAISSVATATVRVVPDPLLDCTDIIGKVFDDKNRNGYQDKGEEGLPGVNVVTARGLIATTDEFGRYHITCAAVPNADRGSNFILKLDERSLPSGYRMTTENPRVKRVTRGKMSRFNFGATIHRVVRLDLGHTAFAPSSRKLREEMMPQMESLLMALKGKPSILRLSYLARQESESLVHARIDWVKEQIEKRWEGMNCCYELVVETEVFWKDGGPPKHRGRILEVRP